MSFFNDYNKAFPENKDEKVIENVSRETLTMQEVKDYVNAVKESIMSDVKVMFADKAVEMKKEVETKTETVDENITE